MKVIDKFEGNYGFLSNFAASPMKIDGKEWPTVEHMFQAAKTLSAEISEKIRLTIHPQDAKSLGRWVESRADWNDIKYTVMKTAVLEKFLQNPDLEKQLLMTGEAILIEGNTWHDNIWGDCYCKKCSDITGHNCLGEILMEVRKELVSRKIKLLGSREAFEKEIFDEFITKLGDFTTETKKHVEDLFYQLIEIEVVGKYKDNAVFRIAAKELWKQYKEEDWTVKRMLKKKPVYGEDKKRTRVIFEIQRKEVEVETE